MATLVVIEGEGEGRHFPLVEPIVSIGRDDSCTIQVLDKFVSRKHLQIRLDPDRGRHFAGDYRSAHGVFVNDRQINLDTVLADGDRIRIGQTTLMYLTADFPDSAAAVAASKKKGEWKRSTIIGPQ